MLNAYDLARHGVEIVLAGTGTRGAFTQAARRLPHTTTMLIDCPDPESLPADHPAAAMVRQAGQGAAFICFSGRCLPPVTDPNQLAEAIADAELRKPVCERAAIRGCAIFRGYATRPKGGEPRQC